MRDGPRKTSRPTPEARSSKSEQEWAPPRRGMVGGRCKVMICAPFPGWIVLTELLTFPEALEASKATKGSRHLLLGNGFSIACREDSFSYGKLFDEADFSALQVDAEPLFAIFGTADFERVIEALRMSASVLPLYDHDATTMER